MGKPKKDTPIDTGSKSDNKNKKKSAGDKLTEQIKKTESVKPKPSKKPPSSDEDSESSEDSEEMATKSKTKKGGFALLMDAESDESASEPESEEEEDESEDEKPKKQSQKKPPPKKSEPAQQEQGGKKGKKSKKKKDDSDDDLEKVLAELDLEYSGKKPPPSGSGKVESDLNKGPGGEVTPEDVSVEIEDAGKSAAQKKKEKKEKQKAAKLEKKDPIAPSVPAPVETEDPEEAEENLGDDDGEGGDKKKKKKKGEKEKEDKSKKGPAKKAITAMQEALKKMKEEEERLQREEEEKIREEEEKEQQRLEMLKLEKEKKERKKKKEKERIDRMKAEGKYLTPKQKADKARAMAMIESLQKMAGGTPVVEKKPRLGTRIKPGKLKKQTSGDDSINREQQPNTPLVDVKIVDSKTGKTKKDTNKTEEEEDIKDSWDAESSGEDNEEKTNKASKEKPKVVKPAVKKESSESDSDSQDESDDDESDTAEVEDPKTKAVTLERIKLRQVENEANKSASNLRAAIVCVLGHVDTGKTKILDKLRRTNVQDGEAGGITQQIGATNVPIENIKEQTRHVKGVNDIKFDIPGLLIIDTPGHESFSNLRSRGSSLCDIAILVVDIMHGLEPQTIESLNLLKARKTPFIVALNKIDRLYDWQSSQRKDLRDVIKMQQSNTQNEFETRTKEVIVQFAEQGLNAALYYENPDVRTYVSLVPTSAITGEGMGNLLVLIIQSCETLLHKRLQFSNTLQATVLEVKAIPGLGTTIDAILINGTLREGDTVVLAGTDGPIVTQIRSILMPQPMKELRVKNAYVEYKEVVAAQGIKIAAKDLEKAVAGLNLQVAHKQDEIEILKEEVAKELKSALSSIKVSDRGVYVQASTLGSLEALLEFLKSSKIPYTSIRIGPVVKRDVMKASAMLEHDPQYAVILAFDVKVERDAQEMADNVGVTIFQADIIYHLFDKFMAHREALKQRKREEFKHIAVFPCKLKILPQFIFNSRDPIVIGVQIEAGIVKEGTPICVPSKDFVDVGIVTSIESNHKQVETARKGQEVCIKIDPIPGEAPKMFGRHFDETDFLVSKISRQSIDACKDYFRDDLIKTDWQLMVELKNLFQIL